MIALVRAVVGAHACRSVGLEVMPPEDAARPAPETPFLTLMDHGVLGYPMYDGVVVLEALATLPPAQQPASAPDGATGDEEAAPVPSGPLTQADRALSGATAFLFDELVNIVLRAQPVAPGVAQEPPLDVTYEKALQRAVFAGPPRESLEGMEEAQALLFRVDADGHQTESEVYLRYKEFAERERTAREALQALPDTASDAEREAAQTTWDQVRADWLVLGSKEDVEEAVRALVGTGFDQGHEAERTRMLSRLNASRRLRVDQVGVTYCESRLVPTTPLLPTEGSAHGWDTVELGRAEVVEALEAVSSNLHLCPRPRELQAAAAGLESLSFQFLACEVHQEWLDRTMFTTHYWDLPHGEVLSDGAGGGPLPGYATWMLFVRDVHLRLTGRPEASFGEPDQGGAATTLPQVKVVASRAKDSERMVLALRAARDLGLSKASSILAREQRTAESHVARELVVDAAKLRSLTKPPKTPALSRNVEGGGTARRSGLFGIISAAASGIARPRRGTPRRRVRLPDGRVRDHRRRPRPGVPSKPPKKRDGTPRKPTRTRPVVDLSAKITVSGPQDGAAPADLLSSLVLHGSSQAGQEVDFPLREEGKDTLVAKLPVRLKDDSARARSWTFVLETRAGEELDVRDVTVTDQGQDLRWTVTLAPVEVVIGPRDVPTLYGYGATLVPACPSPDPALSWPGRPGGDGPDRGGDA